LRSYIQRRGRARKVASEFVVMRSNEDLEALHLVYAREWSPTRRYNFSSNPC
jgi:phage protein U